jgi:hypothetical protein
MFHKSQLAKIALGVSTALFVSGCAVSSQSVGGCAKEGAMALFEQPSVEKQINRVATASAIIKSNHLIINEMPISVDATWMEAVTSDITDEQERVILKKLEKDPYFGTVLLTDLQNRNLTTIISRLSPLEKTLYHRIETFFNEYPDIYTLTASIEKLLKFQGGTLKPVSAVTGDRYANLEEAVISMVPVNSRKDLQQSVKEYKMSLGVVAKKKETLGLLEKDAASKTANKDKIDVVTQEIKDLEKVADEKEKIMDAQWKQAIASIDTSIDDKKIELAKKIYKVLTALNDGAIQAACLYTTAGLKTYGALGQMDKEVQRLAIATAIAPDLMTKRLARLKDNALMTIPNMFVGVYAIGKQQLFISKYIDVIEKIVKIDEDKKKLANNNVKQEK